MTKDIIVEVFNKEVKDLNIEDINKYFSSPKKETDINEFKSYIDEQIPNTTKEKRDNEKINSIIQTICALLNSDGGFLIWGAPKGKTISGDKEESYQGNLMLVEYLIEQDQFINKVSSQISPMPRGILFHKIDDSGKYCYIIQVLKSEYSPHQYKGTYYMRLDGQTHPAPHYLVEALMRKVTYPNLLGHLTFGKIRKFKSTVAIPLVLTINNLSRYLNEKNLEYRLIVVGGDLYKPNDNNPLSTLRHQCDIEKKCKSIFHYNAPFYDEYLLVNHRIDPDGRPFEVNILFSFWGEQSPVKNSIYVLSVSLIDNNNYQYSLKENENRFSYEHSDNLNMSEAERLEKTRTGILESLEKRLPGSPIFGFLNRIG